MKFECKGQIFYNLKNATDNSLADTMYTKRFNSDFERLFSLRGFYVFRSERTRQVIILVTCNNFVLGEPKWKGFYVYADEDLDLTWLLKAFPYPKFEES